MYHLGRDLERCVAVAGDRTANATNALLLPALLASASQSQVSRRDRNNDRVSGCPAAPQRRGDDDAQPDVEHDRSGDHPVGVPVGEVEETLGRGRARVWRARGETSRSNQPSMSHLASRGGAEGDVRAAFALDSSERQRRQHFVGLINDGIVAMGVRSSRGSTP